MKQEKTSIREKSSMKSAAYGLLFQFISLFLNFISKSVLLEILGVNYLGIQGLYSNIFLLFSFAEVGMASVMMYSLYKPIANKDYEKIGMLYHFFYKVYLMLAAAVLVVGLVFIYFLKYLVNTSIPYTDVIFYYLLFLASTVIGNALVFRTYLITADQKKYVVSLFQILFDGGTLILGILVLKWTGNYALFAANQILRNILFNGATYLYVKRKYAFISVKKALPIQERKVIIRNVKDLFILKFTKSLLNSTDNIYISVLLGTIYVGYYANYQLIVFGISGFTAILFTAISASVGNLLVEQDRKKGHGVFITSHLINQWIMGFTSCCLFLLMQDCVRIWMGDKILLPLSIVAIITINYFIDGIQKTSDIFREAAGLFAPMKWIGILKAIINLVLSAVLGIKFGMFGIFLATAIAMVTTTVWYEPTVLYRKFFKESPLRFIKISLEGIILLVLCTLITGMAISFFPVNGWITFFIKAGVAAIVSNLFYLFALSFHRNEFKVIWELMFHMVEPILRKIGIIRKN